MERSEPESGGKNRREVSCDALPASEVAPTQLPALKGAIKSTNAAYRQYARGQLTEEERRTDVLMEEREAVEDLARSLLFE